MAEDTSQEKTELPTARRIKKAKEDGDVARSKELSMAAIMISASVVVIFMGGSMVSSLGEVVRNGLTLDRAQMFDTSVCQCRLVR